MKDNNKPKILPEIPVGVAVTDESTALEAIEKAADAVDRMMKIAMDESPAEFKHEKTFYGVPVSSLAVKGPTPTIEKEGKRMVYAPIPVNDDADSFYNFLISKEGYKMIDPKSNTKSFDKPITNDLQWTSETESFSGTLQVEYANMKVFPIPWVGPRPRDYIVVNGKDDKHKTFYSFSVKAAADINKGSNIYEDPPKTQNGPGDTVRMAIFSAFRVVSVSESCCTLHYFQWMDLLQNLSPVSDYGNITSYKSFIQRVNDEPWKPKTESEASCWCD